MLDIELSSKQILAFITPVHFILTYAKQTTITIYNSEGLLKSEAALPPS
jgi:hypothetical protein